MANNDFGYGILTNVDVNQIEHSLELLKQNFGGQKVNLLEIGLHKGRTTQRICQKLKEIGITNYSYWAVDPNPLCNPSFCNIIIGNSEEVFDEIPNLHWVFIDGCHCINHVMLDFLNYGYKVVKDGLLLFHDSGPHSQGNHYQKHGPRNPDFHIATLRAFKKLDIFNRKDWNHVSTKYDEDNKEWGGVSIFQKTMNSEPIVNFYSKEGQDKWVVDMLDGKQSGLFIDLGATNGISNNNTYALEKYFGWSGVCVEPNPLPRSFQSLVKNRKCKCLNACVYSKNGEVDFVARGRKIEISGVVDTETSKYVSHAIQKNHPITRVSSITLDQLLKTYDLPEVIDYISIDVEGSEWEILKNFNFTKYRFLTMTVENNYNPNSCSNDCVEKQHRDNIRQLLSKHGYILKNSLWFGEDWFIHQSVDKC